MNNPTFIAFLKKREQRRELYVLGSLFLLMGIALQWAYPYPFVMSDSGAYLLGAAMDYFNVYRPQGYSHYLQFLHGVNGHVTFVFWATYVLTAASMLWFLFSAKYLLGLRGWVFRTVCALAVVSPSMLFSSKFLMSDGLFHLLTLLWLTTGMWLIRSRRYGWVVAHVACFIGLYQVRYSGMFYVPISVLALLLSPGVRRHKRAVRIATVCLPLVCFVVLYGYNKRQYYRHTGVNVSSGFSGWQLLNNAAVLFPEAKSVPASVFKEPNLKVLHAYMQNVPDSVFQSRHSMGTGYMWNNQLPLKQFLRYYITSTKNKYEASWAYVGSLYGEYAKALIREMPWAYCSKFILPSFLSTFQYRPIVEEEHPFGLDKYAAPYYKSDLQQHAHRYRFFRRLDPVRRVFNAVYWVTLAGLMVYYFAARFRKRHFQETEWQVHFLMIAFIIVYVGASVLASPNTTWRYSMPIFVPSLVFIGYLIQHFLTSARKFAD